MNQKHQRSRGVPRVGGVSVTEMSTATGKELHFIRVITDDDDTFSSSVFLKIS